MGVVAERTQRRVHPAVTPIITKKNPMLTYGKKLIVSFLEILWICNNPFGHKKFSDKLACVL